MLMGAHVVGTVNVVSVLAMALMIQQALGLSATEVGLLMTAYYSGQATSSLPAGASVDRAGVGRILMMAMAVLLSAPRSSRPRRACRCCCSACI